VGAPARRLLAGEGVYPTAKRSGAVGTNAFKWIKPAVFGRAWGQVDDWSHRIDGQRPLVQQDFQHTEMFSELNPEELRGLEVALKKVGKRAAALI